MILFRHIRDAIKSHALEVDPEEACGLVVDIGSQIEVFRCVNRSLRPKLSFEMDPCDFLRASLAGKPVFAYHSQSFSSRPSAFDCLASQCCGLPYLLYSVKDETFYWCANNPHALEYTGRDFQIGISDCLTLVRDWYLDEIGIPLPDFTREEDWFSNTPKLVADNWKQSGFTEVFSPRNDDVVLFNMLRGQPYPHHLGIFMDNCVLHHPRWKQSLIEPLIGRLEKSVHMFVRHTLLM